MQAALSNWLVLGKLEYFPAIWAEQDIVDSDRRKKLSNIWKYLHLQSSRGHSVTQSMSTEICQGMCLSCSCLSLAGEGPTQPGSLRGGTGHQLMWQSNLSRGYFLGQSSEQHATSYSFQATPVSHPVSSELGYAGHPAVRTHPLMSREDSTDILTM